MPQVVGAWARSNASVGRRSHLPAASVGRYLGAAFSGPFNSRCIREPPRSSPHSNFGTVAVKCRVPLLFRPFGLTLYRSLPILGRLAIPHPGTMNFRSDPCRGCKAREIRAKVTFTRRSSQVRGGPPDPVELDALNLVIIRRVTRLRSNYDPGVRPLGVWPGNEGNVAKRKQPGRLAVSDNLVNSEALARSSKRIV